MVSAYELAKILGVQNVTVYRYIKDGMPHTKEPQGRREVYQFDPKKCKEWIEQQRQENSK